MNPNSPENLPAIHADVTQPLRQDDWEEDRNLWHAFKEGNYAAFTQIYRQHVQALFNFGSKITPDRNLVEDAVHDLFVEIWKNRATLGEVNSVKYYLFKALKRKIIRTLSKKTPHSIAEDYHFEIVFSHEFALINDQINEEQGKKLANALKDLSDRQREAIFLRFYDGLSYEEIASVMSVTIKTAYNFVYMALSQLRQSLTHTFPVLLLLTSLLS
jgi:RNA polymerase sigma factor (sigma-70 family)